MANRVNLISIQIKW